MQLYVTGRKWCDFFQWAPEGHRYERVYADPEWADMVTKNLKEAYQEYLEALEQSDEKDTLGNSAQWEAAVEEYRLAKWSFDKYKEELDDAKKRLVTLCEGAGVDDCKGAGVGVTKCLRAGSVNYKTICMEKIENLEAIQEDYRGKPAEYWMVTEDKS